MVNYEELHAELLAFLQPDETVADFLLRTHEEHVYTGDHLCCRSPRGIHVQARARHPYT
jgi:hypothetical protein